MTFRTEGQFWVVSDEHTAEEFSKAVRERLSKKRYTEYTWRNAPTRTLRTSKQNAALWAWLREISDLLNDRGLDMRCVLRDDIDLPWDAYRAKEHLVKPINKALYGIDSTRDLERQQVSEVVDVINRKLTDRFGISVPFAKGST